MFPQRKLAAAGLDGSAFVKVFPLLFAFANCCDWFLRGTQSRPAFLGLAREGNQG